MLRRLTSKKASGSSLSTLVSLLVVILSRCLLIVHVISELEEDGVRIALTIVDTPGFGDNIDNEFASVHCCPVPICITSILISIHSFQEIVGYLERQYDDILAEESRIRRNPRFRDNRVHALLYFIPPTGHACVCALAVFYVLCDL
jgi:septin family protein